MIRTISWLSLSLGLLTLPVLAQSADQSPPARARISLKYASFDPMAGVPSVPVKPLSCKKTINRIIASAAGIS